MYGKKRTFKMAKLAAPAKRGDTSITIDTTGLEIDLVEGDRIALSATEFEFDKGEDVFVSSYSDGVIQLQTALLNYHWGAPESTAADYNGVDMRGEVLSLTRNIKIMGEDVDNFGC